MDRWFLVERYWGKLQRIVAYDNQHAAVQDYEHAEKERGTLVLSLDPNGYECVLLGADRLSTLIATHGNWFDEPNGLDEAVEAALSEEQK